MDYANNNCNMLEHSAEKIIKTFFSEFHLLHIFCFAFFNINEIYEFLLCFFSIMVFLKEIGS